jgi:hypothetical protein
MQVIRTEHLLSHLLTLCGVSIMAVYAIALTCYVGLGTSGRLIRGVVLGKLVLIL